MYSDEYAMFQRVYLGTASIYAAKTKALMSSGIEDDVVKGEMLHYLPSPPQPPRRAEQHVNAEAQTTQQSVTRVYRASYLQLEHLMPSLGCFCLYDGSRKTRRR